jgi:putative ABC transport system substrate-binding protein
VKFIVKLVAVLVIGLFTALPFAEAQQTGKVWRIGYLGVARTPDLDDAFTQGLRERGYVEGQNLIIVYRFADGVFDRFPGLATELVGLGVDVIVALTTEGVRAARKATKTIPIVMPFSIDPVGAGLISSLARPGGNVTGLSWPLDVLAGKRVQLVKELVPTVSGMAVLWNPTYQPSERILRWTKAAADTLVITGSRSSRFR